MDIVHYHEIIASELFENGPAVVFIWKNSPERSVVAISGNVKRIFGYDAVEFLFADKNYFDLIHPQERAIFNDELVTALACKDDHAFEHGPYRISAGGDYRWVQHSTTMLRDENGGVTHFIGYLLDISERKETEVKLIRSKKMLDEAQRIAKVGSWSLDLHGNYLEWSDEIYRIFEMDKAEFDPSYEGFLNAIHPEDVTLVQEAFGASLENRTPYSITHRLRMNDGRVKFVIENGNTTYDENEVPLLSQGTVQDITEFRELQHAFLQEQRFLDTLINNADSVIAAIDKNGVMVQLNRYGREFTGYSESEISLLPFAWEVLLPEAIQPEVHALVGRAINGEVTPRCENAWIAKNGESRPFEWSNSLVVNEHGGMEFLIMIGVDMTQKKKLEEEIAYHNRELETILGTIKEGIAIVDMQTNFLYVNEAYRQMTGFSNDELLATSCAELSTSKALSDMRELIEEVKRKGFIENLESTYKVKDAKRITINMSVSLMPDGERLLIGAKDVTGARRLEKKMKDYVALVDEHIITSSTDLKGNITSVSKAFCRISQYSESELIGKRHSIIRHPDMPGKTYTELWECIRRDRPWKGEIKNRAKDGSIYWVDAAISPIWDEAGKKIGYTAIRQDITDKKRVEELSVTDALTGLYNRLRLDEVFFYEISQARRYNAPLSIILLDVDHFKSVNDVYGHQAGDTVLKEMANLLRSHLRDTDTAGRWGGEEFLIIMPKTELEGARYFAERLRCVIASFRFSVVGSKTVSLGIAEFTLEDTEHSIMERADSALYRAKNEGRNKVVG